VIVRFAMELFVKTQTIAKIHGFGIKLVNLGNTY
jgi:hypothetical protein